MAGQTISEVSALEHPRNWKQLQSRITIRDAELRSVFGVALRSMNTRTGTLIELIRHQLASSA